MIGHKWIMKQCIIMYLTNSCGGHFLLTSPLRYRAKSLVIDTHTCAIHTQKSRKQKSEQNCWEFLRLLQTNSQFLPQYFYMTDCNWLLSFLYKPTTFFFLPITINCMESSTFFFFCTKFFELLLERFFFHVANRVTCQRLINYYLLPMWDLIQSLS